MVNFVARGDRQAMHLAGQLLAGFIVAPVWAKTSRLAWRPAQAVSATRLNKKFKVAARMSDRGCCQDNELGFKCVRRAGGVANGINTKAAA